MELNQVITTRRAIRKFKKQDVPRDVIEKILENSRWAPVVAQFRQWELVVVTGEMRDRMADLLTQNTVILRDLFAMLDPEMEARALEYYKNLGDAPVLVFFTIPEIPLENRWEHTFAVITATTELMHIWMLAHDEGLGCCGITIPPYIAEQIRNELGLENREVICGLSIGYPDEQPVAKPHPRVKTTYIDGKNEKREVA